MSTFNHVKAGLSNVGSYQASGIPWASSSLIAPASGSAPLEVSFPQVTKNIIVKNVSAVSGTLRVGFSANGVTNTNNFFLLDRGESFAADLRVTKVFLLSNNGTPVTASVIAGLTNISATDLPNNWSGSAGVG
jgi:hypothetical protein